MWELHVPGKFRLIYFHDLLSNQIGLRGGEWRRMLIEEHYHEAAGTSYSDAQASGFEVLPDDVVIKNFLNKAEASDIFEVKPFSVSLEAKEIT